MNCWICINCGCQISPCITPPDVCAICNDERQRIRPQGQKWTTLNMLKAEGFNNTIMGLEPSLLSICTTPTFAIGQRAILIQSKKGNVLWDCLNLLDSETIAIIEQLGGISAIAISHPHFYTSMVEWARQFDVPIYLHEADRQWVMESNAHITFWSGDSYPLQDDITLIRLGGHFAGSSVLHWKKGANGLGCLLSADTIHVPVDHNWVSFMYSYPNDIPLPSAQVDLIRTRIAPYTFNHLYGGWPDLIVRYDAKDVVMRSAERYIQALKRPLT